MKYNTLIYSTLISIIITDSIKYISWVGNLGIPSLTILLNIFTYSSIFILLFFAYRSKWRTETPLIIKNLFLFWIIWNVLNLFRGAFLAKNYWDWKMLFMDSLFFTAIPLVFFLGKNLGYVKPILSFCFKFLFLFGFFLIPIGLATNPELYSRIMIPISLFILFIPYVKLRWKILLITVSLTSVLLVVGFRSNIIKLAFSVLLLIIYLFRNFISLRLISIIHLTLFVAPLIFVGLAITGEYNLLSVLANKEGYTKEYQSGAEENLLADTRTFLYVDVFSSLQSTNDWIFGKSAIANYESSMFYDTGGAINGKRYSSEVGFLNILMRYGLLGLSIYLLLLYKVSKHAINKSSNMLAKMIGLFIAFRWMFMFLEEFTQFDLNFYFFWLAIGLVSTNSFCSTTDGDLKDRIYRLIG